MEIKIEKGIKQPYHGRDKYLHLFDQMEVGDSFLAPIMDNTYARLQSILIASARHFSRKTNSGKKFRTKSKQDEDGVRVWRIK